MKPRRTKLSDITKTESPVKRPATVKKHIAPVREVILTSLEVLERIYPNIDEGIRDEIASLDILEPRDYYFEAILEEIVKSYDIDPDATRQILAEGWSVEDLSLRLPSNRDLGILHTKATEEEFRRVGGTIMGFPCKSCKGFEYYFDADRHIGGSDEASKQQLFCVKCKPRY